MAVLDPVGVDAVTGFSRRTQAADIVRTANSALITQSSHGFSVLDGVRHNGTSWVKAQSDSENTLADGVVIAVLNTDLFLVSDSGFYTISAHGLTANHWYFLSSSSAGALTSTPPSEFVQPLVKALDANTIRVYSSTGYLAASGGTSGSGSGLLLVGEDVVTSGSSATLTVSSLNTSEYTYFCEFNVNLTTAGTATKARLFFNGETSMTGYVRNDTVSNNSELFMTGMTAAGQRRSGDLTVSQNVNAAGDIFTATALYRVLAGSDNHGYFYKQDIAPVTSIALASDNIAWGVGSYLRVYRLVAKQ